MLKRKKYITSLERERTELSAELSRVNDKLKEARLTLGFILDARLPEVVRPKATVRQSINDVLKKRAFTAINPRPEK